MGGSVQRKTPEQVEIPTTSLQTILESHGFDVVNLIFDAEGAEVELLEHEADLLKTRVARLMIELHGRMVGESAILRVVERLESLGFASRNNRSDPSPIPLAHS